MDPDLQRIHDNLRRIIDSGRPEAEEDARAYLKSEGFGSREAWLSAWNAERNPAAESVLPPPLPEPEPPPKQPPFPTLPPMVGGALDALVAFGTGAGLGLPLLSGDTREYMGGLMERNPGTTLATAGVGAAAGLAAAATGANRLRRMARPIRPTAPPGAFPRPPGVSVGPGGPVRPAAPSGAVREFLMRKLLPGGGLLGAWEAGKRLIGG